MRYMLINHVDEAGWPTLTEAERTAGLAAYAAFNRDLTEAGAMVDAGRLQPSASAVVVRMGNGKMQVMDGPFAEAKEVFGGYFIIDVADQAAAVEWAKRCPAVGHGAVEVRAMWEGM
jgi:hypothetical protein